MMGKIKDHTLISAKPQEIAAALFINYPNAISLWVWRIALEERNATFCTIARPREAEDGRGIITLIPILTCSKH